MNNRWTSPLRYPGGKVRMAPFLAGAFAAQWSVMDIEIFLEPFAGGLGAGLKLLEQMLSTSCGSPRSTRRWPRSGRPSSSNPMS